MSFELPVVFRRDDDAELEVKYGGNEGRKNKKGKKTSAERRLLADQLSKERGVEHGTIKRRFVSTLYSGGQQRSVLIFPGRNKCDCQASKHRLVNNCLTCGRVVCEQEGSGPCFFCGSLVCTPAEQDELRNAGPRAAGLLRRLLCLEELSNEIVAEAVNSTIPTYQGLGKAVAEKNKLLQYQEDSVTRTSVFDDQSDYFKLDNTAWLTKKEKDNLEKQYAQLLNRKYGSRMNRKYILDIEGRQIVDAEAEDVDLDVFKESHVPDSTIAKPLSFSQKEEWLRQFQPEYVDTDEQFQRHEMDNRACGPSENYRMQNDDICRIQDSRKCLSVHQPYASFLVKGIKKHEGRSWYSAHRGMLWIASTARRPRPEEIKEIEGFYRRLCEGASLSFPDNYPLQCLLGCVEIVDCLPQEQYQEKYPTGECESPYVFICDNAQALPFVLPVSGTRKIYELNQTVFHAAKNALGISITQ